MVETTAFLKSIQDIEIPIRRAMESVENQFHDNFEPNCQANSVPVQLLTLISLILDGFSVDNKGYSQSTLTCAQLIMSSFKKKTPEVMIERLHINAMLKKGKRQSKYMPHWIQRLSQEVFLINSLI